MLASTNSDLGITVELCAGIIDKDNKTPKEIAQAEVLEECGYDVPLCNFKHVLKFLSGVGIGGANMHLFFAKVNDQMRVSSGGGVEAEGEMIEVIEMSPKEAESYINQDSVQSPLFTIFGLSWFLKNIKTNSKNTGSRLLLASLIAVVSFCISITWGNKKY